MQSRTHKFGGAEDVLELVPCFDLVGDAEVDELDPWVGHVLVQQHDVFWLGVEEDPVAAPAPRPQGQPRISPGNPPWVTGLHSVP